MRSIKTKTKYIVQILLAEEIYNYTNIYSISEKNNYQYQGRAGLKVIVNARY